jgi:mannose-6-phosphate isomerase-like protein (cupin superfamily)
MSPERAPINILLRGEQSGGAVSVIGSGSLPGFGGPPLHHHDFDETFYVIEGELTFQLGDELFTRKAGELAFAPRGVAHTYANLGDAPTRHTCARRRASSATSRVWRPSVGAKSRPNGRCGRSPSRPWSVQGSANARVTSRDTCPLGVAPRSR